MPSVARAYRLSAASSRRCTIAAISGVNMGFASHDSRIDAMLAQPGQRQIQPAGAGVLADIAGDVGQLHGDAEIAGARDDFGRTLPHHQRHHRTDRAGDPRGIGIEIGQGFVAARPRRPTPVPRATLPAIRAGSRNARPRRRKRDRRPDSSAGRDRRDPAGLSSRSPPRRRDCCQDRRHRPRAGKTHRARWRDR